jgi:hypothetical protein
MAGIPDFIASSAYREDLAAKREAEGRGTNWLYPPKEPSGGQEVIFQVSFRRVLKTARTGEDTDWCILAGRIRCVLGTGRFIARVDASPYQAPGELTGWWDAEFVWDERGTAWVLESLTPRPAKALSGQMPAFVREGYNRDDACREAEASSRAEPPWFYEGRSAQVGQRVKVQLRFQTLLPTALANAPTSWCLMGGRVEDVVDVDEVRVSLEATSDNAPSALDGQWLGTLVYDPRRDLPWVLTRLESLP